MFLIEKEGNEMPPKTKFSREEIIDRAFEIVRAEGFESLTARSLAAKMNSSSRVIFTWFDSMDELKREVLIRAGAEYRKYIEEGLKEPLPFKGAGLKYIEFAQKESRLFQLLFMGGHREEDGPELEPGYRTFVGIIAESHRISEEDALKLYLHLWVYSHGIASMCATHTNPFKEEDISAMLSEVFLSLLETYKSGKDTI